MKPIGFIEGFLETALVKPDTTALELIDEPEGQTRLWSYARLLALIERYRGGFLAMNVRPGERVLLQLPSGPDLIACVYALTSINAVFTPVSPLLTAFELAAIVDDLRPSHSFTSTDHLPNATSHLEPPSGNPVISCHYTYKGLGYPLGALHRYDDYSGCIHGMSTAFHDAREAAHLVGLPIYPIYGLTTGVLGPLSAGCTVLLTQRIFESGLLEILERHHVAFACMVPMLVRKLAQNAKRLVDQGHVLRLHPNLQIMSGGSYLDEETAAAVKIAMGVDVYQGYGLTETLIVSATFRGNNKPGSLGVPLTPETRIAIVDSIGDEVAPGRAGEISVQCPYLLESYAGKPAETAQFLKDGWFRTGDLGFKDSGGFLHFLARRCAITKVASQMADLVEVENVIRSLAAVADARVTVTVRPEIGESLAASVVLRDGCEITERELKRTCKQLLSPHKTPREFRFVKATGGGAN